MHPVRYQREELAKVEFYGGSAVHTVLQRYEFSKEEKQTIQRAILTAKKSKPSMSLINRAEELLKEVANSRETKKGEMVDNKTLSSAVGRASTPSGEKRFSLWWWVALPIVFMLAIKLVNSLI